MTPAEQDAVHTAHANCEQCVCGEIHADEDKRHPGPRHLGPVAEIAQADNLLQLLSDIGAPSAGSLS